MAKEKRSSKSSGTNRSFIQVAFLLINFILIKIGNIPLVINKLLRKTLNLLKKHHRRGRPRTKPLITKFKSSLKHLYNKLIPRKNRAWITLTCFIVILIGTAYSAFTLASALPNPNRLVAPDKSLTTEFYDRNGKLLYRLYEGRNSSLINIDDLPAYVSQATISIEDKNFYHHFGVDPIAIIRAAFHNIQTGQVEGASTITQQLIKNTLLTPERTYIRKAKEIILAFWTERIYSKKQILQMYLNNAPYGGLAWGIEAAAQMYFGKDAKDLSLAEASYLAGLPVSPTEYSPYSAQPELGKQRQHDVLNRMVADGYISAKQADAAYKQTLNILPQINKIKAPHFVMYVKDLLSQEYGQRVVDQGGLKVYTTLDLDLQQKVQNIVSQQVDQLANLDVQNGAAMITDPKTGQILAMVGSRDYDYPGFGNFNVTIAARQPGSSIKPITYATAFKQGYTPGNTILDAPTTFRDPWGYSYSPVNYDNTFHGLVTLRTALGSSYNIPAVKILNQIGIDNFLQTAKDLGITTFTDRKDYGLSLTLGAGEVKMIDMMSAYGTFAQNGLRRNITPILKVTDSDGNTLDQFQDQPTPALQPEVAYLINNVLSDNQARTPAFGPNSQLYFPNKTVAVKTGTTDDKRDNWTFGYTPEFVVGAWVGNDDNRPMNQALTSGITGAAPIWNQIMTLLIANRPNIAFSKPPGIINVTVDGHQDLAIANIPPKGFVAYPRPKPDGIDAFAAASQSATYYNHP